MDDFKRFVKGLAEAVNEPDAPESPLADLKARVEQYSRRAPFKSGDIVKWKRGMKNRRFPEDGAPAVVMEVLKEPVFDTEKKDAGSPYFREPLDIICAIVSPNDGDIVKFHFDSHRFTHFHEANASDSDTPLAKLRAMAFDFNKTYDFTPGMPIVWKSGMRNRERPDKEEVAVVMELLPEPMFRQDAEAGMQSFHERLDMKIATLDPDGDIRVYVVDSRRYKPL